MTPPGVENSHASGEMPSMPPLPDIIFSDEYDEPTELEDGTKVVPRSMNRVVVMAFEIDADAYSVDASPISMAGSMNAYSRMWFTATQLAEFIRALGYNAIPMGNDTSLTQPIAIDAGLGEMSRMGIMVTPKYGPRVRLAKVLTDMPLTTDRPITFGVDEFCQICGKCAENCPSGSIMGVGEEKSYEAPPSGHSGALKWAINGAKCQNYWMKEGAECHICIRVCPFTKPDGWLHDATKILIGAKSGSIDSILLKLDDVSGYGPGVPGGEFWEMDDYIHVKDS
jgi:reductive dehalogenase